MMRQQSNNVEMKWMLAILQATVRPSTMRKNSTTNRLQKALKCKMGNNLIEKMNGLIHNTIFGLFILVYNK